MKKSLVLMSFALLMMNLFATDVASLLDSAKTDYSAGKLYSAIQKIENAKKIIEDETLVSTNGDYIEVKKWDIIDLKSEMYIGKKVKMRAKFYGVSALFGEKTIDIDFRSCTFDSSLTDKILELDDHKEYTFYGTVKDKLYGELYIHVEAIE